MFTAISWEHRPLPLVFWIQSHAFITFQKKKEPRLQRDVLHAFTGLGIDRNIYLGKHHPNDGLPDVLVLF
jgi:hypothetical protein